MTDTRENQCELAALYSLDALSPAEAQAFEVHLAACASCAEEVRRFRETAAQVLTVACATEPPDSLRDRVIARVKSEAGGALIRKSDGEWREIGVPGILVKRLFKDPATGTLTSVVRMAPGAFYPRHLHAGLEHLFVLEGDLVFEDHTLLPGDYEVSPSTTEHSSATTHGGCMVLTVSNVEDKLFC